jgi:N-acyl-L-homoserine lactone synthetase
MEAHIQPAEEPAPSTPAVFYPRVLDDDPELLDQCYRLRYRVYCQEKQFLDPNDYPDGREIDQFDPFSIHVGAIDSDGELGGTARVVAPNPLGYPLQTHLHFFPDVRLDAPGMLTVECSRIMISRHYARRRRTEPFLTIIKGVLQQAKRIGATHIIGATEPGFFRLIVLYGMPWRVAGPAADYYGAEVLPCMLSLAELDDVILTGRHRSLARFPVGWDPRRWPDYYESAVVPAAVSVSRTAGRFQ